MALEWTDSFGFNAFRIVAKALYYNTHYAGGFNRYEVLSRRLNGRGLADNNVPTTRRDRLPNARKPKACIKGLPSELSDDVGGHRDDCHLVNDFDGLIRQLNGFDRHNPGPMRIQIVLFGHELPQMVGEYQIGSEELIQRGDVRR